MNKTIIYICLVLLVISCSDEPEGLLYYSDGQYQSAKKEFINDSADHSEAKFNISLIDLNQNDFSSSLMIINSEMPDSIKYKVFYNLGTKIGKTNIDSALSFLKQAMIKNPDDYDSKYNYTYLLNKISKNNQNQKKEKDSTVKVDPIQMSQERKDALIKQIEIEELKTRRKLNKSLTTKPKVIRW